ncbi:MAG: NUDIX domain-containing protein, partial [Pseudonocardiaceae bacterium]
MTGLVTLPQASVTVDLVILTVREAKVQLLLVERGTEPFKGALALPGGFVEPREGLDEAARRELAEETGLDSDRLHLEQVGSYGAPDR